MNNVFLLLEGVDRSGKTSTFKEIVKQSSGSYYMTDRTPLSVLVYAKIFKRNVNNKYFWNLLKVFLNYYNSYFIYFYADESILKQRHVNTNEKYMNIKVHLREYNNFINKAFNKKILNFNNYIEIDTSNLNQKIIAKKIIKNTQNESRLSNRNKIFRIE